MRRWIAVLSALAFLAAGPALAGGKSDGKCCGSKNSSSPSVQMSAGGCGHAMKAGACGQSAAGCASMMKAGCPSMTKAGCGQAMGAACGSMMKAGCGQAMMGACGGSCGGRTTQISHDPSNIWYRGPAPRATMANMFCDDHHRGGRRAMSCGGKADCGHAMKCGSEMECRSEVKCGSEMKCSSEMKCGSEMSCGQGGWKAGAGMKCGTSGTQTQCRSAWKAERPAENAAPKGACCAGHGK
jgi:hypothetical protein